MALNKVTEAIIERIKASLAADGSTSPIVELATPGGSVSADLDLFLYVVTPDPDQRNAERMRPWPGQDDPERRFDLAVPLELRYLVSPGSKAPSAVMGLSRLASAIRAIETGSPLSVPNSSQRAIWLSLLPLSSDEMARVWGLFPNTNCRSSFAFRASPVWIDPRTPVVDAAPVNEDRFHSGVLPEVNA